MLYIWSLEVNGGFCQKSNPVSYLSCPLEGAWPFWEIQKTATFSPSSQGDSMWILNRNQVEMMSAIAMGTGQHVCCVISNVATVSSSTRKTTSSPHYSHYLSCQNSQPHSVSADPSHFDMANPVPLAFLTSEMALTNNHSPSHTSNDSFGFHCGPPPARPPPSPGPLLRLPKQEMCGPDCARYST